MPQELPPISKPVQHRLKARLRSIQTADFYYFVDVAGACNLRCPSCPVGNTIEQPAKGLMGKGLFEAIVNKIRREHAAERIFIDLYNWGEPVLHPQLAEYIKFIKDHDMRCGISTNLNRFPNMREVVKAAPDYLRISLSGYTNQTYQQTHRRGDINAVKANMHLLRHYIDRFDADIVVQVGYHIYKTNFPEDFLQMRRLCDELSFYFQPTIAKLMPLEKAIDAIDGRVAEADEDIAGKLVITLKEMSEILGARRQDYPDCQFRSQRTAINFDGSVPLCCAVYGKDKFVAKSFLDVSRDELQQRKYAHDYCKTCQSRNADMIFTGVPSEALEALAITELGELYRQFIEDERSTDSLGIFHDDKFLTLQEACDLAHDWLSADNLEEAASLYGEVLEAIPGHAEANFQIGWIAERQGRSVDALGRYETAVALDRDNANYQLYLGRLLRVMGRVEKSDAHLDSAVKLNPAMVDEVGALRQDGVG